MSLREQNDRPIETDEDDVLNRGSLVARLCELLVEFDGPEKAQSTGVVVGVVGPWGSGKTSVVRAVARNLASRGQTVIQFNPWVFSSPESLLIEFFEQMRLEFKKAPSEKIRELAKEVERYRDSVAPVTALLPFPFSLAAKLKYKPKEKSISEERDTLVRKLQDTGKSITIIVDDLDRLDAAGIATMAKFVKTIADLPNMSYLLAYDREVTEHALSNISKDGRAYLQKIVQIVVPLRPLMDYEIEDMLSSGLTSNGYDAELGDQKLFAKALNHVRDSVTTPRDLRRLVGAFIALEPLVRDQINSVDLLLYCLLISQYPGSRDIIIKVASKLTRDAPYTSDFTELATKESSIADLFPDASPSELRILNFLFPRKGLEPENERFGRIAVYSNLLRLVYLGNPPTMVSRPEVVAFWTGTDRLARFESLMKGNIDGFLTTLGENVFSLDQEFDGPAFVVLAQDSIPMNRTRIDPRAEVLDSLRYIILSLIRDRDEAGLSRARRIWEALRRAGRIELPAHLLRYHMFAYGLGTSQGTGRGGPTFLEEDEAEKFASRLSLFFEEHRT